METETVKRTCARCGEDFLVKTKGPGKQKAYCSENCRKRRWEKENMPNCPRCRRPRGNHRDGGLCLDCRRLEQERQSAASAQIVADLYNAGKSLKEIGAALGWGENSNAGRAVFEARRRGLVGYRHNGYGEQ